MKKDQDNPSQDFRAPTNRLVVNFKFKKPGSGERLASQTQKNDHNLEEKFEIDLNVLFFKSQVGFQ